MSARLGYPLPSPTPEASAPDVATEPACRRSVEVADLGVNADDRADEGTWLGQLQPNKYSGELQLEAHDDEVQRLAVAAGLPYFTSAQLDEVEAALQSDPRFDVLKGSLKGAIEDTRRGRPVSKLTLKRCWHLAQDMARNGGSDHKDVWAVLVLALRHALLDQNDQLSYTLSRLQMYGAMGQQMSQYGQVLQDAQRALDQALAKEKDKHKQAFVEVPFSDQREYDAESFLALGVHGELHYKQHAQQPAAVPEANALQAKETTGYKPFWKLGLGRQQQHFTSGDGKTWLGRGGDEAARRAHVIQQITQKNQKTADAANLVSISGLGLKVQNYTQQREQLQKLTEKWQTRFQMDHEAKNQTASAITSILKNLHEMQQAITRNVQ